LLFARHRDFEEAMKYSENAANQDHEGASYAFGIRFRDGEGIVQDFEKNGRLLEQTADLGHIDSEFALAELLREHLDDVSTAVWQCKQQADRDEIDQTVRVEALRWYGILLHRGEGIEHNIDESIEYLQSAATSGHSIAQFELGELFLYLRPNLSIAKIWFQLVMSQGHDEARCRYVMLLRNGDIEENDPEV
jgi:TPR repeat protein